MGKRIVKCPKCNNDIVLDEDKETFDCPYCQHTFFNSIPKKVNSNVEVSNQARQKSHGFLTFVIVVISIFLVLIITRCNNYNNENGTNMSLGYRDVTKNDFTSSGSQDLTSYTVTINPNTDIKELSILLKLYNSKGEVVYSDTITKYNLKDNMSYSYTFDFGFMNSLSGSRVSYTYEGKVSLI